MAGINWKDTGWHSGREVLVGILHDDIHEVWTRAVGPFAFGIEKVDYWRGGHRFKIKAWISIPEKGFVSADFWTVSQPDPFEKSKETLEEAHMAVDAFLEMVGSFGIGGEDGNHSGR